MRNTIAYPTQQSSSPSRGIPCSHKWRPSHSGITVSPRMEEMPPPNMPVQRLKVAILPLDLPCSGPVTHSGEILTSRKSHGKKPDSNTTPQLAEEIMVELWRDLWIRETGTGQQVRTPWQIYDDDDLSIQKKQVTKVYNRWYSTYETWWHMRRNQISSFRETDEPI